MLRLILVLVTINVAWCDENCPAYSEFDTLIHSGNLQSLLNGTFFMVYTSAPLTECHRSTYTTDANNAIIGLVQSPGCCVLTDNFNFTPTESTYDVGPVTDYAPNCPSLVQEQGSMKLLSTIGSGDSLCIITAMCQPDYYGINIECRGSPPLLLTVQVLLWKLLTSIGLAQVPLLRSVDQTKCNFPINNCPP